MIESEYNAVLITDLRDVVLQSDPFVAQLPAEVVFASERARMRDCPVNGAWAQQAYGIHYYFQVWEKWFSCSGTTFGTPGGLTRYLSLMVAEIAASAVRASKGLDQAYHTFIALTCPPFGAVIDRQDTLVATLTYMPIECVQIDDEMVLIDGRAVPVLHQWDRRSMVSDHIRRQARFRIEAGAQLRAPVRVAGSNDAVVISDAELAPAKLEVVLRSLRVVGYNGRILLCGLGPTNDVNATVTRYGAEFAVVTAYPDCGPENRAHLIFRDLLQNLDVKRVLLLDSCDFGFFAEPFRDVGEGVELFAEGGRAIRGCPVNRHWVARCAGDAETIADQLIVSSAAALGQIDSLRDFYNRLLERALRLEILESEPKSIQGLFNIIAYEHYSRYRVHVAPNGARALFQIWNEPLDIQTSPSLRCNSMTPAFVQSFWKHEQLCAFMERRVRLPDGQPQIADAA